MPNRRPHLAPRPRSPALAPRATGGFGLVEMLIAVAIAAVVAMVGVAHVIQGQKRMEYVRDKMFATQKALAILAELRGYVEGASGETAAELDHFDDGAHYSPVLTIQTEPDDPDLLLSADHPVSGNQEQQGAWRWYRKISVRPYMEAATRDRRYCTVRVYRHKPGDTLPGVLMAQVSGVVHSLTNGYESSQVYDLYVISLENHPGWWVPLEGMKPYLAGALTELEARTPGLEFRLHWITKAGFGRDEEYAPYTNEARLTTDDTPWVYLYPGRMRYPPPDDFDYVDTNDLDEYYYEPAQLAARVNLDGVGVPAFQGIYAKPEPYLDTNGNGIYDHGESFTDEDDDGIWDPGNVVPYALADYHNHCMRGPDEMRRWQARADAGLEEELTWRLLLDDMVADPDKYHNALFVNMHGDLIPAPPVRNYSDAAKDPENHPSWRVVTHPERLRPARDAANPAASTAPRFRVYAYRSEFYEFDSSTDWDGGGDDLMDPGEPFYDVDKDYVRDDGEPFGDLNKNGVYDAPSSISIVIPGGDFSKRPNDPASPSLLVKCLAGGIDANQDGKQDEYVDWTPAAFFPEPFTDTDGDGKHAQVEPYFDVDVDGAFTAGLDPFIDLNQDGLRDGVAEPLEDRNGNGRLDLDAWAEPFTDLNGNGKYDAGDPFWDYDKNGVWTPPTIPKGAPPVWRKSDYTNPVQSDKYVVDYGEPYLDVDGDGKYTAPETWQDWNGNGVRDGGYERGSMFFRVRYDAENDRTILLLYNTPLKTPETASGRGVDPLWRLYDLDYVPCPTPATVDGVDRFERDLFDPGAYPKNTARWIVELPVPAIQQAFESEPGKQDGAHSDQVITLETRIGEDLTTGTMWPVRHQPTNRSATYAYFYADPGRIPFSERYQFQGDPRHCPYADLDAQGTTSKEGYNWFFVHEFNKEGVKYWLGFNNARMLTMWNNLCVEDVPRYFQWLRTALSGAEAVYTNMAGFNFYYLSLGADTGFDKKNPFKSTPIDGLPFGEASTVTIQENTMADEGSGDWAKSRKLVRSNLDKTDGLRAGGHWWSKPWLGELWPDTVYPTQWRPYGNLRAGLKDTKVATEYRLIQREDIPDKQQPKGTDFKKARGELRLEGCTSFFMIGAKEDTFHARSGDKTNVVVDQGFVLGGNYGFYLPTTVKAKGSFGLHEKDDGQELIDFFCPDVYPHYGGELAGRFFAKDALAMREIGSGIVRHSRPSDGRTSRVVVNGLHPDTDSGPVFASRYALLSLVHTFLHEGRPGTPQRIVQVPRVEVRTPNAASFLDDPSMITVRWWAQWHRWDGRKYTDDYPDDFTEGGGDVLYVLLYSDDAGQSWKHVLDDTPAELGLLPRRDGIPDNAKVLPDVNPGVQEEFAWSVGHLREGTYLLRIEAHRANTSLHYAYHMERIYIDRPYE